MDNCRAIKAEQYCIIVIPFYVEKKTSSNFGPLTDYPNKGPKNSELRLLFIKENSLVNRLRQGQSLDRQAHLPPQKKRGAHRRPNPPLTTPTLGCNVMGGGRPKIGPSSTFVPILHSNSV